MCFLTLERWLHWDRTIGTTASDVLNHIALVSKIMGAAAKSRSNVTSCAAQKKWLQGPTAVMVLLWWRGTAKEIVI